MKSSTSCSTAPAVVIAFVAALAAGLVLAAGAHAQAAAAAPGAAAPTAAATAAETWKPPQRRRIYLMRHGDVAYFDAQGKPVANSDLVVLSDRGRAQADAAGKYLAALGIKKFDRVYSSNLPRTKETAARVLTAANINAEAEAVDSWREMKTGGTTAIATTELTRAFLDITAPKTAADARFAGGESVGELQDRVLPILQKLQADPNWDSALLVLHGLVNNAIISHAMSGGRDYFGRIEHGPGCINVLDMGAGPNDWVVRAVNLCPDSSNYQDGVPGARLSTLEKLLVGTLRSRATAAEKK
jgi:probable phosphoglycerate mutase